MRDQRHLRVQRSAVPISRRMTPCQLQKPPAPLAPLNCLTASSTAPPAALQRPRTTPSPRSAPCRNEQPHASQNGYGRKHYSASYCAKAVVTAVSWKAVVTAVCWKAVVTAVCWKAVVTAGMLESGRHRRQCCGKRALPPPMLCKAVVTANKKR